MKKQKFIQKEMGKEKIVQNKMGFSLIELSIVILIVGALVLGVTKGSALMNKSRTTSAKTLTSSSPVLQISPSDLVAWYEPTLDSSFNASQKFNTASLTTSNGGSWFDNSPSKSNPASAGATAPQYIESSINNLPSVRFNGSSSTLTLNSLPLNQRDYTIFVVEQRRAAGSSTVGNFLDLGGNSFGYSTDTLITMPSGAGSTTSATVAVYSTYVPRILTFLSSSNVLSVTKGVFVNGGTGTVLANAVADNLMTATASGIIGKVGTSFYNGDISEIIIYSKALKADERNDIQKYLSKKYGIAVAATNS